MKSNHILHYPKVIFRTTCYEDYFTRPPVLIILPCCNRLNYVEKCSNFVTLEITFRVKGQDGIHP